MAKVYLHIGLHKTGTSAIQRVLKQQANSLLRREGCACLGYTFGVGMETLAKAMNMRANNPSFVSSFVDEIRQEVTKALKRSDIDKLIFSAEQLAGNCYQGYTNHALVAEAMAEALKGHDVNVLLYLRNPGDLAESLYCQRIHEGQTLTPSEFVAGLSSDAFNYLAVLQSWEKAFGKLPTVRIYDVINRSNPKAIIQDFACLVGSDVFAKGVDGQFVIPSYSVEARIVARHVNSLLTNDRTARLNLRSFLEAHYSCKPGSPKAYSLSKYQRERISVQVAPSNNELFEKYAFALGLGPQDRKAFYKPAIEGEPVNPEKVAEIFMAVYKARLLPRR
jgi:hypothetical protein